MDGPSAQKIITVPKMISLSAFWHSFLTGRKLGQSKPIGTDFTVQFRNKIIQKFTVRTRGSHNRPPPEYATGTDLCYSATPACHSVCLVLSQTNDRRIVLLYHRRAHGLLFLSVQCYAWTEYKFTCVCVCLSVTLSVNSPTGQTLNGFLQLIA